MTQVLLVTKDDQSLELLSKELERAKDISTRKCSSGKEALGLLAKENIGVVIAAEELVDSDGLAFIKELTKQHPMINSSLVSPLPPDDFHEVTEGLGVFMQLPVNPGASEAKHMLLLLEEINVLMAK